MNNYRSRNQEMGSILSSECSSLFMITEEASLVEFSGSEGNIETSRFLVGGCCLLIILTEYFVR